MLPPNFPLETVSAASAGDVKAFGQLVDATRNIVCSIALASTGDVTSSEEIAQEVYLAVWKGLGTLRNAGSFLPWIRQLTRNICTEQGRRFGRREKRHLRAHDMDAVLASVADPTNLAPEMLAREEDRRLVAEAVERLPADAREIVILFYREGRSATQVADLLGISEDAVKKRLSRARARLRETLLDRMSDVLERTVPGAGFTAGVLALITVGAPATATAAGLGAARALGSQSTLAKIASLFGGSILGVSTAAAAIWYGAHKNIERARDDEERSALRRFRQTNFGLLAATFVAWEVGQRFVRAPWGDVVPFVGYFVGLAAMFLLWLPKITARRRAAELREDPKAARRHQREKIFSIVGLILGAAGGGLGLYYGLKMAGRLP